MTFQEIVDWARDKGQLPATWSKMEEMFILSKLQALEGKYCLCGEPWPCPIVPVPAG